MADSPFAEFATTLVAGYEPHLCNDDAAVQTKRVIKRLEHFAKTTALTPVFEKAISLANFGEAPIRFGGADGDYVLLSEAGASLGMPVWDTHAWAVKEFRHALLEQRELDEERGDGRLGYEIVRDYLDLGLDLLMDNPAAKPDGSGRRWSSAGDWLVSTDRLMLLILDSPWREEFFANTRDLMRHAFRDSFGEMPGLEPDLPLDEAKRRARRGPTLNDNQDGDHRG